MEGSKIKGNNPELWDKLIHELDEKLQFGLLERLRRVTAYHFEDDILFIEPGSAEDQQYLQKSSAFQQLEVMAQASTQVDRVKIKKLDN